MSVRAGRQVPFATRPRDPDAWVDAREAAATPVPIRSEAFTARLTVDVTPALRGRIKVAAFTRGLTVADMLRAILADAFPESNGDVR